jgi:excisionase family DNA binding protein
MNQSPLKLAYTVREACTATGLSRSTFYNLFRSGGLKKVRVRGRTLIPTAELQKLIDGADDALR